MTQEDARTYLKLMKDLGISPMKIYKNYRDRGIKTVFVDYTQTGKGIITLVEILTILLLEESVII